MVETNVGGIFGMKLEGRTFSSQGLDTCIICKSTIIVVPFLRHRRAWSIGGVLDVVKTNKQHHHHHHHHHHRHRHRHHLP